jgi:hypothetical protein
MIMTCLNSVATNDILVLTGRGGGVSTVELWGLWTILSKRLPNQILKRHHSLAFRPAQTLFSADLAATNSNFK